MKKLITKKDIILILILLVAGVTGLIAVNSADRGKTATVKADGKTVEVISLEDENGSVKYNGVVICLENGEIYVKDSDCADKICVRSGRISKSGETVICAPNRVSVEINGDKSDSPDALTG